MFCNLLTFSSRKKNSCNYLRLLGNVVSLTFAQSRFISSLAQCVYKSDAYAKSYGGHENYWTMHAPCTIVETKNNCVNKGRQ